MFARMYIQCNVMQFNTLFIIFTLDIKQCPRYVSLKNSLVKTFSNSFPKLINNSSSLNNVNHNCDRVCISDIIWYRCCHFNSPFSLGLVSVQKIGVLVYSVSNTEDHIPSHFQHLKFCQIFSTLSLKIVRTCLPFHL